MPKLNEHYQEPQGELPVFRYRTAGGRLYGRRIPTKMMIRLGIGDVTRPLCPAVSLRPARRGRRDGARRLLPRVRPRAGLRFPARAPSGTITPSTASPSTRTRSSSATARRAMSATSPTCLTSDNTVLIPDPVYPVYVDTNVMDGREVLYLNANAENGFLPDARSGHPTPTSSTSAPPTIPTGAVYTRDQLKAWVAYALEHKAVILFDAAYEAFIGDDSPAPQHLRRSRARRNARSSSAPSPRRPASPAPAAATPWCPGS